MKKTVPGKIAFFLLFPLLLSLFPASAGLAAGESSLLASLNTALQQGFGEENYAYQLTDTALTIVFWVPGLAGELENLSDSSPLRQGIVSLTTAVSSLCSSLLAGAGRAERPVEITLADDRDHAKSLLSLSGGTVAGKLGDQGAEPTEPAAPGEPTMGEQNALRKASDYLSLMGFSYSGLISQLQYEGFTAGEAAYAADNCGADWNEQAVAKARDYLDLMAFSRDGLLQQLLYEGFTQEQAEYAAKACGY